MLSYSRFALYTANSTLYRLTGDTLLCSPIALLTRTAHGHSRVVQLLVLFLLSLIQCNLFNPPISARLRSRMSFPRSFKSRSS
ncbi:hypothetical protein FA15DRAFT_460931 [Coprinopsis marcescibilis]|uniref:Uncharacterized protein n=1 Tax=Coprinopsis marcescibilis TaxID=230819 RepID=A0A5C3KSJ6_COPMA|nr:hypothetical protein FA15DRAFT_460931 [Coprinopsis marcescibilis]